MIDLHCHTHVSDSSLSIEETIDLAKNRGVTHLAITDHDTTAGLQRALAYGEKVGVEIVPGIEISAYDFERNRRAHILGFYVEPDHPAIEHICRPLLEQRHAASKEMVIRLIQAGYPLNWDYIRELAREGTGVYKQHIMRALIELGYTDTIYGPLYKKLFSRGTSTVADTAEQGVAHISLTYVDARDAIAAIISAGGLPVLAHPGQMGNFEAVPDWVNIGLVGIEVFHPDHDKHMEAKAQELAETFGLIMTGGSDYHGAYGGNSTFGLGDKSPGLEAVEALKRLGVENVGANSI
jgi:predicted metal-dependent phosphoesterase TrpH